MPFFTTLGPTLLLMSSLCHLRAAAPFRQYIPSKPTKYGIKICAACDAASSYAWNLQVYTGKPDGGAPEKNQGMQVVLDVTQGHSGPNITCNNFFISQKMGQELLKRKLKIVGTVQKNKPNCHLSC